MANKHFLGLTHNFALEKVGKTLLCFYKLDSQLILNKLTPNKLIAPLSVKQTLINLDYY